VKIRPIGQAAGFRVPASRGNEGKRGQRRQKGTGLVWTEERGQVRFVCLASRGRAKPMGTASVFGRGWAGRLAMFQGAAMRTSPATPGWKLSPTGLLTRPFFWFLALQTCPPFLRLEGQVRFWFRAGCAS